MKNLPSLNSSDQLNFPDFFFSICSRKFYRKLYGRGFCITWAQIDKWIQIFFSARQRPQKVIWHGSRSLSSVDASCDSWRSSEADQFGLGSPLTDGHLLEERSYSCNNKLALLCVETFNKNAKRRRRKLLHDSGTSNATGGVLLSERTDFDDELKSWHFQTDLTEAQYRELLREFEGE